jgi:hypothetical protein
VTGWAHDQLRDELAEGWSRLQPHLVYHAGHAGIGIYREYLDHRGFTGIQWAIHVGRKVWVWRRRNRRLSRRRP